MMSIDRLQHFQDRVNFIAIFKTVRVRDRSNPMEDLSAPQFRARFRLTKETTIYILDLILEDVAGNYAFRRGTYIPPVYKLLIALRFYATGTFQIVVGDLNALSQGTISKTIKRVTYAIGKLSRRFIQLLSPEQLPRIKQRFYEIGGFPGVIGAVDCTHVHIDSPGGQEAELFCNQKTHLSINVQGICDADLIFSNIVARWYGSAHDSRIFENSNVKEELDSGRLQGLLLGDSGYTLFPYLMTPFRNPAAPAQRRYNRSQIKTRNVIERAFGVLKRRFACLNYMRLKLDRVLLVIVATSVLHNVARKMGDVEQDGEEEDENDEDQLGERTLLGEAKRQEIVLTHFP